MNKLVQFNTELGQKLKKLSDFPLLFFRIILAIGFSTPALMKLNNIGGIIEWFESLGIPFPTLNAYLATYTEVIGFVFLALGFATRIISIPLIIVMLVAIKTVHFENGFEAGDNGYEIPLYYILMLFTLFVYGPGKWSLDYLISKKIK
ncbi:DoxX family protein [Flavobacterium sp. '19STA2R22 D10 B1']|uniref:HvfX family Cu-binding RiPP maturation protein n=1 Tax=Flavobacterium aerium TaxID=3037261 RepID=UPI00278BEDAE|nr:DoxX family protein [Flavobacterium sp. '19STA2R22 D10 B1']